MQLDSARWPRFDKCHDGPFNTGTHTVSMSLE